MQRFRGPAWQQATPGEGGRTGLAGVREEKGCEVNKATRRPHNQRHAV